MAITKNIIEHPVSPSGLQWSTIFAGTAVACAISVVLLQFGSMIGLAADSPLRGEGSIASWGVIATGIWLLWISLLASLAGGYIAGAMRGATPYLTTHENEMRDGIYGLTVWATSTVAAFIVIALASAAAAYVELHTVTDEVIDVVTKEEQNATIIFAFAAGATSLISAAAAWWAATMAGDHRDNKVDFSKQLSFKK